MTVPETLKITEPVVLTLKDGSKATLLPFNSPQETPDELIELIKDEFNEEIDRGDTYCQDTHLTTEQFINFWFVHFVAVLIKGELDADIAASKNFNTIDYKDRYLACFKIIPNYEGRSSHNCNGSFLVSAKCRGLGIGSLLGKEYIKWAKQLQFKYSVFNLVYESNVASSRIWDGLGFDRIGRVPNAGILKGHDKPVDAIMFGYDLTK